MQDQQAAHGKHPDASAGRSRAGGRGEGTSHRAGGTSISRPARERLFRATFERAVIGIAHVSPHGRWLRVNQRLCDILGYDHEELAARSFQDLTHPDDREASGAYFRRLLAGELDAYELDKRYIRKDGRPVWVHLTVSLVRTPEGEPDYTISMVQDITERKRLERKPLRLLARERAARAEAEAALERAQVSEARAAEHAVQLRTILETMADGVLVYDREGRVVQTNRAYQDMIAADRVPEYEVLPLAERIALLNIRDAATDEPRPLERISSVRALRGEVVTGHEGDDHVRAFDGRELVVNLSSAPLRDDTGHIVGAVTLVRDMTERNRLEREREEARAAALALRELNRRKDEFLSVLSHEIRTPLASLQGYIQLLVRSFDAWLQHGDEAAGAKGFLRDVTVVRTALAYSEESVQRLTHLTDDLVDDTRIRDGRLTLRCAPCDLGTVVRAAVEAQRALNPDRVIHLEPLGPSTAGPRRVLVIADADRIGQVVTNYLTNALKYSRADRPVSVRLEMENEDRGGEWARVSVRDAGPGLPPSVRARVWERFPRIEGVAVKSGSGVSLGLGLHICKAIVEVHGGRVGVESAVGHGSTFWFTLPFPAPRVRRSLDGTVS